MELGQLYRQVRPGDTFEITTPSGETIEVHYFLREFVSANPQPSLRMTASKDIVIRQTEGRKAPQPKPTGPPPVRRITPKPRQPNKRKDAVCPPSTTPPNAARISKSPIDCTSPGPPIDLRRRHAGGKPTSASSA